MDEGIVRLADSFGNYEETLWKMYPSCELQFVSQQRLSSRIANLILST